MQNLIARLLGKSANAVAGIPMPKPTRLSQATISTEVDHRGVQHFYVDHRALERNKYAPWGRGHLSGLPQ